MPRRVNLIPMAGLGQRFVDAGYSVPKPLIRIGGKEMILRATESLPACDETIFICRQEHIEEHQVDRTLRSLVPNARVLSVPRLTEGQAATCLVARRWLRQDDELTIGACDAAMEYDRTAGAWDQAPWADAVIWTFRDNPTVLRDPRMYGWVDLDGGGTARRVSVKAPLSDTPMRDHAVIGAFSFRRAGDFLRWADDMISANRRVRNEFYVDELMNVAIESGARVGVREVDRYVGFGTPADVEAWKEGTP